MYLLGNSRFGSPLPWCSPRFDAMDFPWISEDEAEDIWRYLSRCTGTKPKMPYTFFNLYCFIFNQTSAYVCLIEYWILVLINDDSNIDGNSQRGLWEAEAADATAAARGRSECFFDFSWRPNGFPMGKSWENHGKLRKTMGQVEFPQSWWYPRSCLVYQGKSPSFEMDDYWAYPYDLGNPPNDKLDVW